MHCDIILQIVPICSCCKECYERNIGLAPMTSPENAKQHVAIAVDTLSRGGAEKVALSIANNLDTQRYTPIMITTRGPGEMAVDLRNGIEHFSLCRKRRFDIAAIRKLARFLDDRKVAITHSHNHSTSYFLRVVKPFCSNKWKHVVHDHHGPVVGSWKMALLDKLFLRSVDFYIGVSQTLTDRAASTIGLPNEKCIYLPNGIHIAELATRAKNSKIRIIQVGRLEPVKNHLMAVRIASELNRTGLEFEWLFVGRFDNTEYYRELQTTIVREGLEGSMTFLGEQSDVSSLLRQADIGILTSRHEGLSIAMLEYMAHGLPVVITDVGQSSDIIHKIGGGSVVPQEDHSAAAQSLLRLNADAVLMETCGRNNREYAVKNFSETIMVESIIDIYDRLLSTGGVNA